MNQEIPDVQAVFRKGRGAIDQTRVKAWLKTQHSKTKFVASSPITSWQVEQEKVEAVTSLIFLGSKSLWIVTAATKFKRLLLGKKAMTNTAY